MTTIKELEDRIKKLEDREHMEFLAKINPQKGDILLIYGTRSDQIDRLKSRLESYGIDIPIITMANKETIRIVNPSEIRVEETE